MQGSCRVHAGFMQGSCRVHAGFMKGSCRVHQGSSGFMQDSVLATELTHVYSKHGSR
jgi:hypothetical protein